MYIEIINKLEAQVTKEELSFIKSKGVHLGVFAEPYLSYMLEGKKTIESRFSKKKIMPYGNLSKDDIIIVKKACGNILAYMTIKDVLFFDLNETSITEIKSKYSEELYVDEEFWKNKGNSNYATLIIIDKIRKLEPFHIDKKGMQTWIKLK